MEGLIFLDRKLIFATSLLLPVAILFILPFNLSLMQGGILAAVVLAATWWATGIVNKNAASIILLAVFILFSDAPLKTVLKFPLSVNFYLIIFAFLISEGITKSQLTKRISKSLLAKFGHTPARLVLLSFVLGIILIFFIPQPFPRVILVSSLYVQFLKDQEVTGPAVPAFLFSIYIASTCTTMMFLTGDVLLNYIALQMGEVSISWIQWAIYMTLPSTIISLIMYVIYMTVFKKDLSYVSFKANYKNQTQEPLSRDEKRAFIILIFVLVLWMTEPLHRINPAWVGFAGAAAMYLSGLIEVKDIKKINLSLLIFLTAAFSIGGVMNQSGVAEKIFSRMVVFLPEPGSLLYITFLIGIVMVLHLFLGSSVTTISVALPGLIGISKGMLNPVIITLIVYTAVSIHYLLPFHHVTILIGAGENHYSNSHVIRYGAVLTILVFLAVLFIEIPWWRLMGLI